jgi:hypothetical protein
VANFVPTGDRPQAIEKPVSGRSKHRKFQPLEDGIETDTQQTIWRGYR